MKNVVLHSFNDATGHLCGAIVQNSAGRCWFRGFRRDLEDDRGWFPFGSKSGFVFQSVKAAPYAAIKEFVWLEVDAI